MPTPPKSWYPFFEPMLAHRCEDRRLLHDAAWAAEPKLDGQRAQVHVEGHRTVAVYTRPGNDMLGDNGLAWARALRWPFAAAVFDGELYSGAGTNTTAPDVRHQRSAGGPLQIGAFDLLAEGPAILLAYPWEHRRKRLEVLLGRLPAVTPIRPVPVADKPQVLWDRWTAMGGEGIILKARHAPYQPGKRSRYWLKLKVELTVDVVITGLTDKATYRTGGYVNGEVVLLYGFYDVRSGRVETTGQGIGVGALRAGDRRDLTAYIGRVAEVRCAAVMPSGALRSHQFVCWRPDKRPEECLRP